MKIWKEGLQSIAVHSAEGPQVITRVSSRASECMLKDAYKMTMFQDQKEVDPHHIQVHSSRSEA